MPGKDVIPTIPYRLSRSRYRHSRVSGNPAAAGLDIAIPLPSFPRKRESRTVLSYDATVLSSKGWIPAYAGMTVQGSGPFTMSFRA